MEEQERYCSPRTSSDHDIGSDSDFSASATPKKSVLQCRGVCSAELVAANEYSSSEASFAAHSTQLPGTHLQTSASTHSRL
ncbi:hypothetical protein SERLA73DRAFT_181164, partial [Serpula lacrymans var. lacrymans S7.3]